MAEVKLDDLLVRVIFRDDRAALGGIEKRFNRLTSVMSKVGIAAAGVGGALVGGLAIASKAASDYELAMSRVAGLAGASAREMAFYDREIRKLAQRRGESLTDLAAALFPIHSAGFRAAEAMQLVDESTKVSKAGLGDVATAGRIATRIMEQYAKTTKSVTIPEVFDTLVFGVQRGNFDPTEMIVGMERMTQIPPQLGISFHEVTALLAGMSKARGPQIAARQLEAIMRFALRPTEMALQIFQGKTPSKFAFDPKIVKAVEAVGQSGYSYDQMRKRFGTHGFFNTLELMNELFGGTDSLLWSAAIEDSSALAAIKTLLGSTREGTRALIGEEGQTTGLRDEAYGAAAATMQEIRRDATNAITGAREAIGKQLDEPLKWVFQRVEALANAFTNLNPAIHHFISLVLLAGVPILAIGVTMLSLIPVVKAIPFALKVWAKWAVAAKVATALAAVKVALLSAPILAITGAIVAVGVAIAVLARNWKSFQSLIHRALPPWLANIIGGKRKITQMDVLNAEETRLRERIDSLNTILESGFQSEDRRIDAERALEETTRRLADVMERQNEEALRQETIRAAREEVAAPAFETLANRVEAAFASGFALEAFEAFPHMLAAARGLAQITAEESVFGAESMRELEKITKGRFPEGSLLHFMQATASPDRAFGYLGKGLGLAETSAEAMTRLLFGPGHSEAIEDINTQLAAVRAHIGQSIPGITTVDQLLAARDQYDPDSEFGQIIASALSHAPRAPIGPQSRDHSILSPTVNVEFHGEITEPKYQEALDFIEDLKGTLESETAATETNTLPIER